MCRRIITNVFRTGTAAVLVLAGAALFAQESLPPAAPPAPFAPLAAATESLKGLLDQLNFGYAQPKKDVPMYRVTVESNGEVAIVVASEAVTSWKANDGSDVRYTYMWSAITPVYSKDIEIPTELTLALAKLNDNIHYGRFSIFVDEKSGNWMVLVSTDVFLKGATPEVVSNHLYIVQSLVRLGHKQLLPFVNQSGKAV